MRSIEVKITQSNSNTKYEIINDLMRIEKIVYEESCRGKYDSIKARFEIFSNMFILAYDGDELIGYLCWFPISKMLHNRIIVDKALFDDDIKPEDVVDIGEENYIYIISVAILPEYQRRNIGTEMMKKLIRILKAYSENGKKIKDVLTSVISEKGEGLVLKNGFVMVENRSESGYKLYRLAGKQL